jgi:hypothetical protein
VARIAPPETPLKRHLREEGRRQDWLAEHTGIHSADISRIVNRGMDPGKDGADAILRVLRQTRPDLNFTELGWPHYETDEVEAA